MGKKKYNKWLGDDNYRAHKVKIPPDIIVPDDQIRRPFDHSYPPEMLRGMGTDPGLLFGLPTKEDSGLYVGCHSKTEGNYAVVGGCGSGKSSNILMPTLRTFDGAICATDVKGELSDFYKELYRLGLVDRPWIIFDPMQIEGPSYDPFDWLLRDDETRLVSNIWEIALAIIPVLNNDIQPFWAESERGVLAAALLYYFKYGLSFSETMTTVMMQPTSTLCEGLKKSGDVQVQFFLGEAAAMKPETLANIDRGLRNKLMLFAADPYISHAFRGRREGANCFTWEDLNTHNIFLRIPADKIEEWGGAVNLMYTQLMRHLERRPEMYSTDGATNVQTLLMMDEFARFGKLEMITAAMATLRSKNVNICLAVQSVAQLDKIYGECDRRIIFDNCPFQIILRANDADTQKYLCKMIGTAMRTQLNKSEHLDECMDTTGYSRQASEIRDLIVQPHELATLQDVLLLTPFGFYRAEKFQIQNEEMKSLLLTNHKAGDSKIFPVTIRPAQETDHEADNPNMIHVTIRPREDTSKKYEEARVMSIEERMANANRRIGAAEQKQREEERTVQETLRKKNSHRNYIIGELVAEYFPNVLTLEPGTQDENIIRFEPLEAFLYVLSTDYDLVKELQERAAQLVAEDPDGEWRLPG